MYQLGLNVRNKIPVSILRRGFIYLEMKDSERLLGMKVTLTLRTGISSLSSLFSPHRMEYRKPTQIFVK